MVCYSVTLLLDFRNGSWYYLGPILETYKWYFVTFAIDI